jgi:predicted DNA-binding protein (MmcQ/YjbR family)
LREEFPEHILPGYHMSKVHWNTIISDGYLNEQMLKEQIMHSYALIRNGKKQKK